jgi:hypothetical protein
MNCLANTAAGAAASDDGHQRWLDEQPEKMRQRRETAEQCPRPILALMVPRMAKPPVYPLRSPSHLAASLFFSWLTGAMSACGPKQTF